MGRQLELEENPQMEWEMPDGDGGFVDLPLDEGETTEVTLHIDGQDPLGQEQTRLPV